MAATVLTTYRSRVDELDPELAQVPAGREPARAFQKLCIFCTQKLKVVSSIPESRAVQESKTPSVVISASGMATGGRVLHHLEHALPDPRNTILFAGYQAVGTRGQQLRDGEPSTVIHGHAVPVGAQIETMDSMSAHADSNEILRWLSGFQRPPSLTCLVHGEPVAMDALKDRIVRELGWNVKTPGHQETMDL
jgi:metallo-beta-lactamase family protein